MAARGVALAKDAPRGAFLARAVTRLEERFGTGVVLTGAAVSARDASRRSPFGISSLDALLGGGLAAGEPAVLLGAPTSGALTLALEAAAAAQARGGEVAWVDPTRSFDPFTAARHGIDLERLLLLRVAGEEVPFTATTVARSAAFVLLVIDLGPRFGKEPQKEGGLRSAASLLRGASFGQHCSIDALAPVVAQARAAGTATLVLTERPGRSLTLPAVEVRRVDWIRHAGRAVGWRSLASHAYRADVARLSFAPLALPPTPLVDEGLTQKEPGRRPGASLMPRVVEAAG